MTVKHFEIARFSQEYGVNLEWLLEGRGRIFKSAVLSPDMSGAELAAVVATLPAGDQSQIDAKIRELLQERGER